MSEGEAEPLRGRRGGAGRGLDPVDLSVGSRLRQARLLAGATQKELALAMGVGTHVVQRCESGRERPSPAALLGAARRLGRPLSFFFHNLAVEGPQGDAEAAGSERDLVHHFRSIDDERQRQRLVALARRMAERALAREEAADAGDDEIG
jgi:transcriptional regulator with XRE-family HTH domain